MNTTLRVLVPKKGTPASHRIYVGSGIVASGTTTPDGASIEVYYEGNKYGLPVLQDFSNKVIRACMRCMEHYPTIARGWFPASDFIDIGTVTFSNTYDIVALDISDEKALKDWANR